MVFEFGENPGTYSRKLLVKFCIRYVKVSSQEHVFYVVGSCKILQFFSFYKDYDQFPYCVMK